AAGEKEKRHRHPAGAGQFSGTVPTPVPPVCPGARARLRLAADTATERTDPAGPSPAVSTSITVAGTADAFPAARLSPCSTRTGQLEPGQRPVLCRRPGLHVVTGAATTGNGLQPAGSRHRQQHRDHV